ncbi:MAG: hypothetical protein IPK00_20060 [Deltaproteobacteria bacterium]|nr:hypothetical protein [Deltaproteobacteria bacterium]
MATMRIRSVASFVSMLTTCIALVAFAAGCGGGPRLRYRHEFSLAPGQQHHAGLAKALLIPLDYANSEPIKGLNVSNEKIAALIVTHLESKGITVERIDPARFRDVADEAYRAVLAERKAGASGVVSSRIELGDVVPRIVEKLETRSDLVVSANVVMRTGEWNGGSTLVWDGVRRRDRTAGAGATTGTSPGSSLEVALHAPDGARVFSGYGGLDLVFQFNLQKKIMEIRPTLLQDESNLAEGVCVAFYPYFGMEEYCNR